MITLSAPPIDPFTGLVGGIYADGVTQVRRGDVVPEEAVRTRSFATWAEHGVVHLSHQIPTTELDNDLAGLLAEELFSPGWLSGGDLFERLMTGVILTSAATPEQAWGLFYHNTLDRLARLAEQSAQPTAARGAEGSLADYAPVYERALELVAAEPVLELGSCFGFLSLLLARGRPTTASDVTRNSMRLLNRVASRMDLPVETLVCDAARVPRRDASYDTVLAVHLLEHLPPQHGALVVGEMQRLAARRVIIAVPFEDEPTAAFGHVRAFDLETLAELAHGSRWRAEVFEHHGGWLVLDRR